MEHFFFFPNSSPLQCCCCMFLSEKKSLSCQAAVEWFPREAVTDDSTARSSDTVPSTALRLWIPWTHHFASTGQRAADTQPLSCLGPHSLAVSPSYCPMPLILPCSPAPNCTPMFPRSSDACNPKYPCTVLALRPKDLACSRTTASNFNSCTDTATTLGSSLYRQKKFITTPIMFLPRD